MTRPSPSHTVEDYLKAIFVLEAGNGRATTSSLAGHLEITAGSVSDMLRKMAAATPRLIDYKSHHGARLTAGGRKAALDVIRRHRLLETFLHQVLSLGWDEVHTEAEILEHHLSPRVTEAIDTLLGHPRFDPHGEPIPTRNGSLPQAARLRLADAPHDTELRIVEVQPNRSDLLPYLDSLGIGVGTRIVMTARAPLDGPLSARILGAVEPSECSIAQKAAERVFVAVPEPGCV